MADPLAAYAGQVGYVLRLVASVLFQLDPVAALVVVVVGWLVVKAAWWLLRVMFVVSGVEERRVVVVRERQALADELPVRSVDPWVRRKRGYR